MNSLQISLLGVGNINVSESSDINNNDVYLLGYPCSSLSTCSPYRVNFSPGVYFIECWGAQGVSVSNIEGGKGGYSSGIISLSNEKTFYFNIGASGYNTNQSMYNGGGKGTIYGGSGGGATDMRFISGDSFSSLASRIMVAAGGSGSTSWGGGVVGSDAGGLSGYDGNLVFGGGYTPILPSKGANQTGKGSGELCYGGDGTTDCGSGAGGGYFGGQRGYQGNGIVSTGGGGSSYISGHSGCIAIDSGTSNMDISFLTHSIHSSGIYFTQTQLLDGKQTIPTVYGNTMIGHKGSGIVRITVYQYREPSFPLCTSQLHNYSNMFYLFLFMYLTPLLVFI